MKKVVAIYMMPNSVMLEILPADRVWSPPRDAREYWGPDPVVAAPPCAQYSRMKHMARDDPAARSCAPRAVEQVREFGGVLEHPAGSLLWKECNLPAAGGIDHDEFGGWTLEVCQFFFGHVAIKRTWLYIVGVPREKVIRQLPQTHKGEGKMGKLQWENCTEPARLWTPHLSKNGKTKFEKVADQHQRLFRQRANAPQQIFTGGGGKYIPGSRWYLRIAYPFPFALFLCQTAAQAKPRTAR